MNVLGFNAGHDSGACLLTSSRRIFALNEERLSRKKLHVGFPRRSIQELLAVAGLQSEDVDLIIVDGKKMPPGDSFGFEINDSDWKKLVVGGLNLSSFVLGTEQGLGLARKALSYSAAKFHRDTKEALKKMGFNAPVEFVDHHTCHAASAYYSQSEFDKGMALTMDASGEGYCSKIFLCDKNVMELVHQVPCYFSPAYYYGYLTKQLGFTPFRHEGKVTGLAAFGNGKDVAAILNSMFGFDSKSGDFYNHGGYHRKAMRHLAVKLQSFTREDVAAGLQIQVERMMCEYVLWAIKTFAKDQPTAIFSAGGLFANVRINQEILTLQNVASLYVFPNMGDGGISAGAALLGYFQNQPQQERFDLSHLYLARDFTDDDIEFELKATGVKFRKSSDIAQDVAALLSNGKVVARFNGSVEYGPRALGNRSIMYSPADRTANDWLNKRLKRTEFMPFAPFVRDVDAHKYFDLPNKPLRPYRFMTATCQVRQICKDQAPAVVHVDGTARPQIIYRDDNPSYYDILTKYQETTGCGVLVNTSFNMHEEPIVYSPKEALLTFQRGGLDALAIGNFICTANNNLEE